MRRSVSRHGLPALAAGVIAIFWASAAAAAPGKLCSIARGWVEGHCDGGKVSRVATPARCARARDWLDAHCPSANKAAELSERAYRSTADVPEARVSRGKAKEYDEARQASRHRKHARNSRARVHAYVERPRSCCYSEPQVHYRTTPYRDVVFNSDFVPRPGWEWAFYKAQEANRY